MLQEMSELVQRRPPSRPGHCWADGSGVAASVEVWSERQGGRHRAAAQARTAALTTQPSRGASLRTGICTRQEQGLAFTVSIADV